ncbi:tyrosine-protein phosphatase non-receptor type 21 [Eurytemora carolleeae]|uniref:tyrosine-protein phosphatase non-receptor type 21 n=1 Tax=Eurytemora carolleeae TaxID=1294199 RepID=UPI000C772A84|nr:tyrosine-protein phosphatase non-receptor type 21 [Eurytemora carolleeae]|eukprot:XP_023341720.1 tyrosine-protein phosphatase non-receptor type 21-like [Eurytemora affinis]
MPFPKIKFKKQQYNVSSKSVFVITVELLDSSVLECTLSADSTGRDCMDNICTRLGLQQPDLFGLRFVSRRAYPRIRWVELDRPLKKQLEKYSREPYLYLGVIFYVTDVSLLEDEVTRYHYFLQLKTDVVEGRLRCNYEQAIVLASYSLQAEFGDHDPEKHTAEYLKDFPLLPKPMISHFEDRLGALTDAIVTQHNSLRGIAAQLAEIYYIVGAQQLEGYGQECFLAKDDTGNEVLIGASLTGICVRKGNGNSPQFFRWRDITNLVNHKKYFGIDCQNFEFSVQFVFNEPDAAKYVWKICVLQHTFFKMHQSATESCEMNITVEPGSHPLSSSLTSSHPLSSPHPLSSSPLPPLHLEDYMYKVPPGPAVIKAADIKTFQQRSQNIPLSVEKRAGNSSISGGLDRRSGYTTSRLLLNQSINQTGLGASMNLTLANMPPKISNLGGVGRLSSGSNPRRSSSSLNINQSLFTPGYLSAYKEHLFYDYLTRARSTNDLDRLEGSVDRRTGTIVPMYRPAPDYETAVMSKYKGNNRMSQMAQMYSSHPEIRQPPPGQPNLSQHDLRHLHLGHGVHNQLEPEVWFPLNSAHTYSTPELNTAGDGFDPLNHLTIYKPPPPYPGEHHSHFSSSTPDLASQTLPPLVGGSSPDLVSRRTLGPAAGRHNQTNPDLNRTYDNLTGSGSGGGGQEPVSRYTAYSTEELNAVYNIGDQDQSQLLNNIINETYNPAGQHNYIYDQQRENKRISLHQVEQDEVEQDQHQQHHHQQQQQQHQQHQQQQQQLALILSHLEGQQLDEHQLGLLLTHLEGLSFEQQQVLGHQLETQRQQQQGVQQQNDVEVNGEPIYQNQGQIIASEGLEPIYQNLPLPKLEEDFGGQADDSNDEIYIDDTVDGPSRPNGINVDRSPIKIDQSSSKENSPGQENSPATSEQPPANRLNIRKAITLSREDLSIESTQTIEKSKSNENLSRPNVEPARRKIEMRQYLEPAVKKNIASSDLSLISSVNNSNISSPPPNNQEKLSSKMGNVHSDLSSLSGGLHKKSLSSLHADESSPQSLHKPKGRKRWGLNMAVKSGSLKSTKSDKSADGKSADGDESRNSSGRGMGAMMLANLHGLTRSRPDLLSDTIRSSSPLREFKVPSQIPKQSIGPFLEAKLQEGEVVREFQTIPKKKSTGCTTDVANLPENIPRNRFKDVVPYDTNRVRINNEKDNKYGYINASHISATVGSSQRFYIAAQGPLPCTVHNFWTMVHMCDVHLIVMLTEVSGASKTSACIPYWPQNDGSSIEIGDFTITKNFSSNQGSYTTTTLQLLHTASRYRMLMLVFKYISLFQAGEIPAGNNKNPPVLLHCSAGVGRTGVTILADILLYCVDHNIDIDVPKVLTHLREQRMLMVQTLAQYQFVHTVLINYLSHSRLI